MAPGLVIFDCDGVLVDSERISIRELTRAIHASGGTLSEREVWDAFMGRSLETVEAGVAAHLGRPLEPDWIEAFMRTRAEAFERELQPIAGARETVLRVAELGYVTCIASQGRPSKMEQTLRVTGLHDCFPPQRTFSATMVQRGKPAPDLYLHAARTCGFDVERCVVVEDSVTGVTAARAAGMRVLGYAPDGGGAPLEALGAELVRDLRAVPERVAALLTGVGDV